MAIADGSQQPAAAKALAETAQSPLVPPGAVPIYTHTTQCTDYLLTESAFANKVSAAQAAALAALKPAPPLDAASAMLLQNYYLLRLPMLAKAFGLPERVLATSMTYFKRFWTLGGRSPAEPLQGEKGQLCRGGKGVKTIMLISLYLATKTHSAPISLPSLAARVSASPGADKAALEAASKETEDTIRDNEFEVASVLCWRFRVVHAFEAVRGIAFDLQALDPPLTPTLLDKLVPHLTLASHHLRLTNAEFLFTPSQLALSTWYSLCLNEADGLEQQDKDTVKSLLHAWLDAKFATAATRRQERENGRKALRLPAVEAVGAGDGLESTASCTSSLVEVATHIVSAYLAQGAQIEKELGAKSTVERVKSIDLSLKDWSQERAKHLEEQGGQAAKRKAAASASNSREPKFAKRAADWDGSKATANRGGTDPMQVDSDSE